MWECKLNGVRSNIFAGIYSVHEIKRQSLKQLEYSIIEHVAGDSFGRKALALRRLYLRNAWPTRDGLGIQYSC
jgi:hypothetical protein